MERILNGIDVAPHRTMAKGPWLTRPDQRCVIRYTGAERVVGYSGMRSETVVMATKPDRPFGTTMNFISSKVIRFMTHVDKVIG